MITETHIRNLQNSTKFVKIAKNSRNSTITHKSRLLKYKINKSILNQNKCQLTRNKQPPKHTAARRTPESVPSATKRIQNGQSSANHELSSDLFYESGYDAVGVQQIVDSAGVSKPTLYYYFGSKQGLLEALLNEHFQPMEQKLIEASETGKNIPEKLYRIARAFFNGASEDPKFHMLMMALFYSGRKSEGFRTVYPMIDRFYHLCVDVFDNASAELGNMNGRQEQFAVGFSGILMHYLMMTAGDQSDLSNLVVRDEEVYRLVHQFMYGIYS